MTYKNIKKELQKRKKLLKVKSLINRAFSKKRSNFDYKYLD